MPKDKVISILGCGWYGLALAKTLLSKNYTVKGSATTQEKMSLLRAHEIDASIISIGDPLAKDQLSFFDADLLVITIPAKEIESAPGYLKKIDLLISTIEIHQIRAVILISSTSVYGDVNAEVTESDPPNPTTLSGRLLAEAESKFLNCTAFSTTIIRFGGLYGPGRDPGRFLAGRKMIPNGLSPVNLIHLNDCLGLTLRIIETESYGHIFNACSPTHPSRQEFYINAARKINLELPEFIEEKISWKIVSSINIPELLDYQFKFYC